MQEPSDRRPLASRDTAMARRAARWLGNTSVTPNQISYACIVAGLLAFICCAAALASHGGAAAMFYVLAAFACQLRLLCNLLDGMVAIEAGKQTRDGAFWNEMPDRIADIFILLGVGVAAEGLSLGWAAATLAVFVAYLRELGKGIDGAVDFQGPMAKQHRMALVTIALLLAAGSSLFSVEPSTAAGALAEGSESTGLPKRLLLEQQILRGALWLCIAGCLLTLVRRSRTLLRRLQ